MKKKSNWVVAIGISVFIGGCALPKFHPTKTESKSTVKPGLKSGVTTESQEEANSDNEDQAPKVGSDRADALFLADRGLSNYRKMRVPFKKGTSFIFPNGADLVRTPIPEKVGLRYLLDLNVPYGTPILAAENGKVIQVHEPKSRGGCDPSWEDSAHFVRIEHHDGTVAQYSHLLSRVTNGQKIKKGQIIGVTNRDGFICVPQLTFGVFKSAKTLPHSPQRETLPIYFEGLEDGILKPGQTYKVLK